MVVHLGAFKSQLVATISSSYISLTPNLNMQTPGMVRGSATFLASGLHSLKRATRGQTNHRSEPHEQQPHTTPSLSEGVGRNTNEHHNPPEHMVQGGRAGNQRNTSKTKLKRMLSSLTSTTRCNHTGNCTRIHTTSVKTIY